ncbi:peptidase [Streptomyces spiroverticillatus]|uniref:Peptidase n=1 Tax=Streptomyces finlayi TaxID=67296 RepID=A0A918WU92_9ACTN|nr:alpha/beta hydrolase [Streptomyces finlayi]GGZ98411.1 peptidase [Streptomyces spiroverticillatus]GHC83312.1 peptidase [Streptomyces finlayi]
MRSRTEADASSPKSRARSGRSGDRSGDRSVGRSRISRKAQVRAALVLAAALALTSCGGPEQPQDSATANLARPDVPAPEARWDDCPVTGQPTRECTTLKVPIDAAKPGGGKIDLAVSRIPATDRKRRVGVLVMDSGGLGLQGLYTAANALPPHVRALFDIVGFDRRGTGRSTPVDCGPAPAPIASLGTAKKLPGTPEDTAPIAEASKTYIANCQAKYGQLLAHLGTADVTADLESIRLALHEDKLNLLLHSYGTLLGQDYLAAHPTRVRAAVLDSTYDPNRTGTEHAVDAAKSPEAVSSTQDLSKSTPYAARLRAYTAGFRAWCSAAGPAECALSPDPQKLLDQVARKAPNLQQAAYAVMADPADWPGFSRAVDLALDGTKDPEHPAYSELRRYAEKGFPQDVADADRATPASYALTLANHCNDFAWPRDTKALLDGITKSAKAGGKPDAAPALAAAYAPCAQWPQSPTGTLGPLTLKKLPPAKLKATPRPLLVNTERDPRTPMLNAWHVGTRYPAALLRVGGTTHNMTLKGNPCVTGHLLNTLVTGVPPKNAKCPAV